MRILVLSDLHREVWRDAPIQANELLDAVQPDVEVSQPDVVVLAGDIDAGDHAVAWADRTFPTLPVIYVHGDHEAYGRKLDTLKGRLAEACAATGHVHFLDKREVVIGNVRFLGATLWTDFQLMGADTAQEAMHAAAVGINDYRKIRLAKPRYRKIRPLDVAQWHLEDRIWLHDRLSEYFAGPTVVVTHMGPTGLSIPARYRGQLVSAAFASNLETMTSKADLWVHGHIHDSMDYWVGKARVVCNPLGYPQQGSDRRWHRENPSYDPHLIVEIGELNARQQILLDAKQQREAMAARWPGAAQAAGLFRIKPEPTGGDISELRRAGKLLGVYLDQPVPSYRYPLWQFDHDGLPVDHLAEILAVLRDFGPFKREPDGLRRTTGWGEAEWFLSPNSLLGGVSPAAILPAAADRVLRAARIEFAGDD